MTCSLRQPPLQKRSTALMRPGAWTLLFGAIALLFALSGLARAADDTNPLRPADTSSPRATLHSFLDAFDAIQRPMVELMQTYVASDRLYLDADERQRQRAALAQAPKLFRFLDVSQISPVLRETVSIERALQLDEVLERIKLPAWDDIPDRDAVSRSGIKRWRLPDTEIDIVQMADGDRAGEWLFSAATVERLPEYYERVKALPYKPGPASDLAAAYRNISGNPNSTIYEAFTGSPAGLRFIPVRWMLGLPQWTKIRIAGVSVWQWTGFAITSLAGLLLLYGFYRLSRWLGQRRAGDAGPGWHQLLVPLVIMFLAGAFGPIALKILRFSGTALIVITFFETIALSLASAWATMSATSVVAEWLVASERLRPQSMDSQLIRLALRFVGIVAAIAILMEAANELGFPAFSVLAGLGVGGLAVALAARDSLANLFGSILIMFEKPFRVGHRIRLSGSEGTVEDVGFRSTRIRTADNSLISIPNNTIVNATVENLTARTMLRQNMLVQITYGTTVGKIEEFRDGIERLLLDSPAVNDGNIIVRLNDLGESSLNIVVRFHLLVEGSRELPEREAIILQVIELAARLGVEFAFPTRTLVVEPASGDAARQPVAPLQAAANG